MPKKKTPKKASNKKHGNRLNDEQKKQLKADILSGVPKKALMKKYHISEKTARNYNKKIIEEKKRQPASILDMKKALDLAKANSMLHYSMEQMEIGMKRIDEDHEKHRPETQIKMAVEVAKITLEIHNTLYYMETPDMEPEGYGQGDIDLQEEIMSMMTDKQKEALFEKFTGQKLAEIIPPEPANEPTAADKA